MPSRRRDDAQCNINEVAKVPDLPPEIVGLIAEQVYVDIGVHRNLDDYVPNVKTLTTMQLVNSTWRRTTMHFLYKTIVLRPRSGGPDESISRNRELLKALVKYPQCARAVESLTIKLSPPPTTRAERREKWAFKSIVDTLPQGSSIRDELMGEWHDFRDRQIGLMLLLCSNVKKVGLFDFCGVGDFALEVLTGFCLSGYSRGFLDRIEHVRTGIAVRFQEFHSDSIRLIRYSMQPLPTASQLTCRKIVLKRVAINGFGLATLFASCPQLKELSLGPDVGPSDFWGTRAFWRGIGDALRQQGRGLTHLCLELDEDPGNANVTYEGTVGSLKSLNQMVELTIPLHALIEKSDSSAPSAGGSASWPSLSTRDAKYLTTVLPDMRRLRLLGASQEDQSLVDRQVCELLVDTAFSNLREIRVFRPAHDFYFDLTGTGWQNNEVEGHNLVFNPEEIREVSSFTRDGSVG